jgi:acyl transferase domain-containing protein/thioesterase domain-containing protein/acyl carrier protein
MSTEFDIAIIGMAGRWPGARTLDEFWRNLAGGVESITRFSDDELIGAGVSRSRLADGGYVKAAPVLDDPGHFDARFFGYSPTEARALDPQQRLLLEIAHEALEHAACDPDRFPGRVGVFTGAAMNTYFMATGLNDRLASDYIPTLIGNDKDFLSTRISYKLNLTGPSITVQTACSTSLVAIHLARQSLLTGETDLALAGAISVRVPHRAGYVCDGGGIVSPDGHVRAFAAGANGTVFGSGGGILVLKRLSDAVANGDTIHAVIKGSAVNNDGSHKAGFTAPSVNSQAEVVVEALANAGVTADSISYVEGHGSGTPIGDPIEVQALTNAFRTSTRRSGYCAIGSVKTNIGHLDAAAGLAGVIKTVLALQHRQLPPTLHFQEANPAIDFTMTPFYVNNRLLDWTSPGPRRAGVMATGMGGTNAHVVLEEAPPQPVAPSAATPQLLVLSAKTPAAVESAADRLADFLRREPGVGLEAVASTLQLGRKAFSHRRAVVCSDREDAIAALSEAGGKRVVSGEAGEARRPVIFMLPGVGDQYVGMAHGLYDTWQTFRDEVDRCAEILRPHLGADIRGLIYPETGSWKSEGGSRRIDLRKMIARQVDVDPDSARLNATITAQPALFTIEYALARLWQSWGVVPDAMIGQSLGEYVAACLAGVVSLEDALRLIAVRARLVSALDQGGMLAVTMSEAELRPVLPAPLSIALINGPRLCVIGGPVADVAAFETRLADTGIVCRRIQNAHAFHTAMLAPVETAFEAEVARVTLKAPRTPYVSSLSGTWITDSEAMDPSYWARHTTHTVRFSDALRSLWQQQNAVVIEVGPGRTLGVLAMQHPDRANAGDPVVVSSVRQQYEHQPDTAFILQSVGKIWSKGTGINWEAIHAPGAARRIALPTYPFERQHYWLDQDRPASAQPRADHGDAPADLGGWFYTPGWQRAHERVGQPEPHQHKVRWLIVGGHAGEGGAMATLLNRRGIAATVARFGERFTVRRDGAVELDPRRADDYRKMLESLGLDSAAALNIVHLGALTGAAPAAADAALNQDHSFNSLLHIARTIADLGIEAPVTIGVISNGLHDVTGEESLHPDMATVLGACGVIPKEFPNIQCFNVDLPDDQTLDDQGEDLLIKVLAEFSAPPASRVVAYRGRYRWERRYQSVALPAATADHGPTAPLRHHTLRQGGVYVITGGTGGIGLVVARYLATTWQARLVLTKRTPLPARTAWPALVTAADTAPALRTTLTALLDLETRGGSVEVVVGDVTDAARMRALRDDVTARYGRIHGVIHAAGIFRDGLIRGKTQESVDAVMAPKLRGTTILFDVFKDTALDFLVLFSSLTSILTPYAVSEHSAANAFLDAFGAFANRRAKFRTVTINWPGWRDVGQLANLKIAAGLEAVKQAMLDKAIRPEDGVDAFTRVLNSDLPHVLVSPDDLHQLLAQSYSAGDAATRVANARTPRLAAASSEPSGEAGRPRTPTEQALDEIWQEVLGTATSDIHASFFDLGGHSLLAIKLFARIEARFGRRLPLSTLLEHPTIAQLAAVVEPEATVPQAKQNALVHIKPLGSKPPLFCVHAIGGEVLPFQPLAATLSADQPFYGLQWVHDQDGPRFPSIAMLATRYIKAVKQVRPNGPYMLAGYCSGALIAWEMAQQLTAGGDRVGLVVLIDHALPVAESRFNVSQFLANSPYWVVDDLLRVTPEEFAARLRGKVKLLLDSRRRRSQRSDIRDALGMWNAPEKMIKWIEGHYEQQLAYRPQPYAGAVTIVRARAMPLLSAHRTPESGWAKLATSGARVHRIPGNHGNILQEPWVRRLAAHVQADLDAASVAAPQPEPRVDYCRVV